MTDWKKESRTLVKGADPYFPKTRIKKAKTGANVKCKPCMVWFIVHHHGNRKVTRPQLQRRVASNRERRQRQTTQRGESCTALFVDYL